MFAQMLLWVQGQIEKKIPDYSTPYGVKWTIAKNLIKMVANGVPLKHWKIIKGVTKERQNN